MNHYVVESDVGIVGSGRRGRLGNICAIYRGDFWELDSRMTATNLKLVKTTGRNAAVDPWQGRADEKPKFGRLLSN